MSNRILEAFDSLTDAFRRAAIAHYGNRLVSVAVFGSVARRTPGPESDVDILLVVDSLPDGRMRRVEEFEPLEAALAAPLADLERQGIRTRLSPVFKTPAEAELGGPIFLDMTQHVLILFDRGDFLGRLLSALRAQLEAAGARRVPYKGAWYWDLGPPAQPGHTPGGRNGGGG